MTPAVTLEELLIWNDESADFWKSHFESNPTLLELPCGVGGAATVQDFVRHIWGAELRWAQRIAGQQATEVADLPSGPLDALFDLHRKADEFLRAILADPNHDWEAEFTLNLDWIPVSRRAMTHRKMAGHGLIHSQQHWAQLATLVRTAGFPSGFKSNLLFSSAFR